MAYSFSAISAIGTHQGWLASGIDYSGTNMIVTTSDSSGATLAVKLSRDRGANWTTLTPLGNPMAFGNTCITDNGIIYIFGAGLFKSVDYGANWTDISPMSFSGYFATGFADTRTGKKIFCVAGSNTAGVLSRVFWSSNGGASWTETTKQNQTPRATTSQDGAVGFFAAALSLYGSYIHKSTDYGASWVDITPNPGQDQYNIASDWTGTYLISSYIKFEKSGGTSNVYVSSNGGTNWTAVDGIGGVGISDNGQCMTKHSVSGTTQLFQTSQDYGVNWTTQLSIGSNGYGGVAVSGDGSTIIVGNTNGYAYIGYDSSVVQSQIKKVSGLEINIANKMSNLITGGYYRQIKKVSGLIHA